VHALGQHWPDVGLWLVQDWTSRIIHSTCGELDKACGSAFSTTPTVSATVLSRRGRCYIGFEELLVAIIVHCFVKKVEREGRGPLSPGKCGIPANA
jgi:hypothetical protein